MQSVVILAITGLTQRANHLVFRRHLKLKIAAHKAGFILQQHKRLHEVAFKKWKCDLGYTGDLDWLISGARGSRGRQLPA